LTSSSRPSRRPGWRMTVSILPWPLPRSTGLTRPSASRSSAGSCGLRGGPLCGGPSLTTLIARTRSARPLVGLLGDQDPDGQRRRSGFQFDAAARCGDLKRLGGFVDVAGRLIRWTAQLTSGELRALYASLIEIRQRPHAEQQQVLDALEAIADAEFGGVVHRPFVTALYTGRRPETPRENWYRRPLSVQTKSGCQRNRVRAGEENRNHRRASTRPTE